MAFVLMKTDIGVCVKCGCSKHEGQHLAGWSMFWCRDCGVPNLFVWKTTRELCESEEAFKARQARTSTERM